MYFCCLLVLIPVKAGRQLEIGKFSYSLYFCFSLSVFSLSLLLFPSLCFPLSLSLTNTP